jgi:amino acid transporter
MAVVTASQVFLPKSAVTLVAVAALVAAATSINGVMMGLSRDFFQGASGGLFPDGSRKSVKKVIRPFAPSFLLVPCQWLAS